jgi:acyl-CoA thioesterase I
MQPMVRMRAALLVLFAALGTCGCGGAGPQEAPPPAASYAESGGGLQLPAREPSPARFPLVVFFGDSLTAGYGLEESQAFPALLETQLAATGTPIRAVNAGVSGDTSAGGVSRLSWLLKQHPDVLVVELGANDAMRGQPPSATEANLRRIVETAKAQGVRVLLVGMLAPPNYGPEFTRDFAAIYPRLSRQLDVPLVPFLLEGVAGRPELNLADGIHPTPEGHAIIARTLRPYLEKMLVSDSAAAGAARP